MAIKRLLLLITFGIAFNMAYSQEGSIVEIVDTNGLLTKGTGPNRPLYLSLYYDLGFTMNIGEEKAQGLGRLPGVVYGFGLLGKARLNKIFSIVGSIDYTRYSNYKGERSQFIFYRERQMWNILNYTTGIHISFQGKRGNILGPYLSVYSIWSHSMVAKQRIRNIDESTGQITTSIFKGLVPKNRLTLGYRMEFGFNRVSVFYQSINNDWSIKYDDYSMAMTRKAIGIRSYLN